MIRFLFHHRSRMVDVVEVLGVAVLAAAAWRLVREDSGWLAWIFFALILIEYGFIRFCTTMRWYKNAQRYEGIELQFRKAMSPTVYVILIGGLVFQTLPSTVILAVTALLIAVVAHVNVILLYLKRRDHDPLPVNFFSHNKFV